MREFRVFREKEMSYSDLLNQMANFLQSYARSIGYQKSKLRVRTGRLRNSIVAIPEYSRNRILFGVGVVYGRIHEFGGVIRPRNAKKLWIPTKQNQTRAGVPRFLPRDIFEQGFVRGNIFFLKQMKKIIPMFVLKDKVEIPERKYLYPAIQNLNAFFGQLVEKWAKKEKIFEKLLIFHRRGGRK